MYIIKSTLDDAARAALVEQMHGIITAHGGTIDNVDDWGMRDFAYEVTKDLEKENAELKKQLTELKEFYEIEYFQIADRTADEKIKELEKHQVEATVDDYSPYDENTWGDMHEEWFVPKEEVRDLLKENYALIIKAKELLKQWLQTSNASGCNNINIVTDTEQFLKDSEVEK
jgi:ribosomal protein S6